MERVGCGTGNDLCNAWPDKHSGGQGPQKRPGGSVDLGVASQAAQVHPVVNTTPLLLQLHSQEVMF